MTAQDLLTIARESLENMKAQDMQIIDLKDKTDFADFMVVVSGTSDRHLHAMADKLFIDCKNAGCLDIRVEGEDSRDWVLVDLGDIIVHLMRPETRALYALEKLWSLPNTRHV